MASTILREKMCCSVALTLLKNIALHVLHDSLHWALAKPPGTALGCKAILVYWIELELQVAWHALALEHFTIIRITQERLFLDYYTPTNVILYQSNIEALGYILKRLMQAYDRMTKECIASLNSF